MGTKEKYFTTRSSEMSGSEMKNQTLLLQMPLSNDCFTCLSPLFPTVHIVFFQVVKWETSIIETLNYFSGIIISVKTRSEQQLLRLKQINMQLAAKIQQLEFSCSEKVRKHFWGNSHRQHSASHARPLLLCALSQEHLSPWLSFPWPCLLPS